MFCSNRGDSLYICANPQGAVVGQIYQNRKTGRQWWVFNGNEYDSADDAMREVESAARFGYVTVSELEVESAHRMLTEVTGNYQRVVGERDKLDDRVHALEVQLAKVTKERDNRALRCDQLLALVRAVSLEAPDAHEAIELRGHVAALIAEVGTLRAHQVEITAERNQLLVIAIAAWLDADPHFPE